MRILVGEQKAVEIYRLNNRTQARAIILRMRSNNMKSYMVALTIGDFRIYLLSRPTTVKELWHTGLHIMRLMRHNGVKGRFIVRSYETGKTIFWLYSKVYDYEYIVRLASIRYARPCGGYTF